MLFSVEKVTTGAYTFEYVIWNSNPVRATIVGGSLLFPAPLTIISAKAKFLDEFKVTINQWYIQSPPKTAEVFQRNNNLSFIFTNSVYIITSYTNIKIISIYCNTCLVFKRFRIRRKRITWFVSVIIPQTSCCFSVIFVLFKQIVHWHYKI